MTSSAFEGGNGYYIFSSDATEFEFRELKIVSKIRKTKKNGTYKFNTVGIIRYFISL